jgi:hypothetical protein
VKPEVASEERNTHQEKTNEPDLDLSETQTRTRPGEIEQGKKVKIDWHTLARRAKFNSRKGSKNKVK